MLDRLPPAEQERTAELDALYRELYPVLLRFAEGVLGEREDAEEAVHEAFIAAARAGPLREPRPWLFRVTRNEAVSLLRRRRRTVGLDDLDEPSSSAAGPEQQAETAEDMRVLRRGVDLLPEKQRTALLLRELGGCSYDEIERILDVSEANVKVLLFRARKNLQDFVFAVRQPCDEVQLQLSARHDGELGRAAAARARLHTLGCRRCGRFAARLRDRRVSVGALVPLIPWDHVHLSTLYAFEEGAKLLAGKAAASKSAGGVLGIKATAAATTAAVVTIGAGGVAVFHPKLPDFPVHQVPVLVSPAPKRSAPPPAPPATSESATPPASTATSDTSTAATTSSGPPPAAPVVPAGNGHHQGGGSGGESSGSSPTPPTGGQPGAPAGGQPGAGGGDQPTTGQPAPGDDHDADGQGDDQDGAGAVGVPAHEHHHHGRGDQGHGRHEGWRHHHHGHDGDQGPGAPGGDDGHQHSGRGHHHHGGGGGDPGDGQDQGHHHHHHGGGGDPGDGQDQGHHHHHHGGGGDPGDGSDPGHHHHHHHGGGGDPGDGGGDGHHHHGHHHHGHHGGDGSGDGGSGDGGGDGSGGGDAAPAAALS